MCIIEINAHLQKERKKKRNETKRTNPHKFWGQMTLSLSHIALKIERKQDEDRTKRKTNENVLERKYMYK